MRTPDDTALLLAYMLKLSAENRVRFSEKTLRLVSGRKRLHLKFVTDVVERLEDWDIMMTDLPRGGYAIIKSAVFEDAPQVFAKHYLKDTLKDLKGERAEKTLAEIRRQLGADYATDEDED